MNGSNFCLLPCFQTPWPVEAVESGLLLSPLAALASLPLASPGALSLADLVSPELDALHGMAAAAAEAVVAAVPAPVVSLGAAALAAAAAAVAAATAVAAVASPVSFGDAHPTALQSLGSIGSQ